MKYTVYKWEIKSVEYFDLVPLRSKARVEGVVMDASTKFLAMFIEDHIVGFVGWMDVMGGALRYKSDWVHPDWRGLGIYSALFAERLKQTATDREINAYCTSMSLPVYLKNGFKTQTVLKRGSTYVILNTTK